MTSITKIRPQADDATSARGHMKIVIVGHVDHGKSTLVGRLIHDTGSLPEGKYEAIKAMSERRGMPFEWAFLMDALQAERDQGITIDTTQIWFKSEKRDYVIIDAPGHKEFLKNMVTGAASANAATLVIDAHEGIQEQSKRHGYLLHLLGVRQIAIAVNKMDLVNFDEAVFNKIEADFRAYLASFGVTPTFMIPVSARDGDNIVSRSERAPWYKGPTLVEALDGFEQVSAPTEQPLRFPVQDVYKFDDRRIIAGRIETGRLKVGDTLLFSPSNKKVQVKSIEAWSVPHAPSEAHAGQSVGITLSEQIFVERGDLASHADHPPIETDVFNARLFWLGRDALTVGKRYKMKLNTSEVQVTVQAITKVIDTDDLSSAASSRVERNSVAEVTLRARKMIALDDYSTLAETGRFVLVDNYDIAGGGIISMDGYADQRKLVTRASSNIQRVEHRITTDMREERHGHAGGIVWFTGLSGAGKSTIAVEVENRLHALGYQVYVLDGDNIRHGLNSNLGFSPEDRAENIRRIGEVAALFASAGVIAITSFISPYRSDRDRAREVAPDSFHEIYVKADVATCESRDPKGLYKKARTGEIAEFTGISAPYEAPEAPELVVDTANSSVDDCVQQVVDYVRENFSLESRRAKHGIWPPEFDI
ncbi:adenylyl-sulfate kinase [Govanella unica]|uniref:Adenylyl-sulfate kinase n=1 Tax=Govanella unica TaxID=2975056 RepID=A0A9X3TVC8_9PROT|nr:adenylyl-sulfate kinase [Govania unica]MDA5192446.1 adenylyl-sulfate kinase [Govania unica]